MDIGDLVFVLAVFGGRPGNLPGWGVTESRVVSVHGDVLMVEPTSGEGHKTPWKKEPGSYWLTEQEAQQECDRRNEATAMSIREILDTPIGVEDLARGIARHAQEVVDELREQERRNE